jgi:hypothetical protein
MRSMLLVLLLTACGGASQQQLAETPSASNRGRPAEPPPASTSDQDRSRLNQQFEDMETTQRAYREAGQSNAQKKPAKPLEGQPPQGTVKKKGVAEQGYLPPKDDKAAGSGAGSDAPAPKP